MSSKRFGKKPKKPKVKDDKDDGTAASGEEKKSVPAPKAAKFAQKHFQRRTSG